MLLTVVIVTKNPGSDIFATLASVLPLDDESVEILIKDNSDDTSIEEINGSFQFTNFRYVHSPDDGIYDAMNQAINLANGEYIYFLNAGDTYIDCDLLNILKNDQTEADFFYGNIVNLYPFARQISYSKYINKYTVYLRRVCHQAIVVKKDLFDQLGLFDTNLSVNADYLFILRLFDQFKGKSIQKLICIYKGGGFSYDYELTSKEIAYLRKELRKFFNPIELKLLSVGKILFSWMVSIKNFNKPT
ncbi:glycosyltransferase [Rhodohalobacter sulfatireducens]|uniref:Glycosyltransferase n=1 Tax=Rhodohalobacter sulfatireducens TaxID=2911366 RepID=A0ABS9KBG9_9BACT|nr:glycosyltransferase [Rhodohalobacter sulfatireducens]MCG2588181.1 glycosyltransferase [Rhodohalobacter sulfatireducens]